MRRGRPVRDPSRRNLEIVHELTCEGRSQPEVTRRFGLSQPRVAEVRRHVEQWIETVLAGSDLEADPGRRLHLAIAARRLTLESVYGGFLQSLGGGAAVEGYGHLWKAVASGVGPKGMTAGLPPRRVVASALRMMGELESLAQVASRGPYGEPAVQRAAVVALSLAALRQLGQAGRSL